jgi:transketolase
MSTQSIPLIEQRVALGDALVHLGQDIPNLLVLSPDVSPSTRANKFKAAFPDRFVCTGISEQNTIGLAAGLATMGWVPLIAGYAMFIGGKAWEPLRNSIGYSNLNVKIAATHAGLNVGPDGVTHQAIEDIALMRSIPGMTVLTPMDAAQVEPALRAAMQIDGPVYIRLERAGLPTLSEPGAAYPIGGSVCLREGHDVTIMAIGGMVTASLQAAEQLAMDGVEARVVAILSIKPLDEEAVAAAAIQTGAVVTAEDHNKYGGLGGVVAETLVRLAPVPMEQVAVDDVYAESGTVKDLYARYRLTPADIAAAVKKVIARKQAARSI